MVDAVQIVENDANDDSKLEQFACDSNQALKLNFVSNSANNSDYNNITKQVSPVYTHHLFDKEIIFGYSKLQLDLKITAGSLDMFLDVKFDEQLSLGSLKIDNFHDHFSQTFKNEFLQSNAQFKEKLTADKHFKPHGQTVYSFDVNDEKYFINHLTGKLNLEQARYISNFQALNHFYIEFASNIDISDQEWEFYIVYHKNSVSNCCESAGYLSVYNFYAYPDRIRQRISQVLILPHHQQKGLGTHLLSTFYKYSRSNPMVRDITVEEPNPDFAYMRDKLDLKQLTSDQNLPTQNWPQFKKYCSENYKLCYPQMIRMYQLISIMPLDSNHEIHSAPFFVEIFAVRAESLIKLLNNANQLKEDHPEIFLEAQENLNEFADAFLKDCQQMRSFLANLKSAKCTKGFTN